MTSNSDDSVQQVQDHCPTLLASVTGPEARAPTADTVERTRCRRLLALGAALWRLFLVTRAAGRPAAPVPTPDGPRLPSHDPRPTTSSSVFGHGRVGRQAFTAPGPPGLGPLEAALS